MRKVKNTRMSTYQDILKIMGWKSCNDQGYFTKEQLSELLILIIKYSGKIDESSKDKETT